MSLKTPRKALTNPLHAIDEIDETQIRDVRSVPQHVLITTRKRVMEALKADVYLRDLWRYFPDFYLSQLDKCLDNIGYKNKEIWEALIENYGKIRKYVICRIAGASECYSCFSGNKQIY